MKLPKSGYTILLLIFASVGSLSAQDLAFSQFYHTPFLTNPAAQIPDRQMRIFLNFRNQSLESGDNFTTPMFSLTYPLGLRKSIVPRVGLGLSFLNDNATDLLTTNGMMLGGVYHLQAGSRVLVSLGVQGGFFQRRIAIEKITTDNQYLLGFFNPNAGIDEDLLNVSATYWTANLGGILTWKDPFERNKSSWGLSLNNFNEPKVSLFKENISTTATVIPRNITFTGCFYFYPNEKITWIPNLRWIYRLNQHLLNIGSKVQFNFGSEKNLSKQSSIDLGLWYNTNKALVMSFEFQQPHYWIALSYDQSTGSKRKTLSNQGVLEMTLGLKIPRKVKSTPPIEDTLSHAYETLFALNTRDSLLLPDFQAILLSQKTKLVQDLEINPTIFSELPPDNAMDTVLVKVRRVESNKRDTLTIKSLKQISPSISKEERAILNKKIRFNLNSGNLSQEHQKILKEIITLLKKHPDLHILVMGHTCDIGEETENQALSLNRAITVQDYLIQQGIEPSRIKVKGMGSAFPIVPNNNSHNRTINRRVEFKILPQSE